MPGLANVNGDIFSWNSCEFLADVFRVRGVVGLDFADKIENEYVDADNQDGTPIGMTYGNYRPDDVKLTVLRSKARAFEIYVLTTALVPGTSLNAGRFTLSAKLFEPSITGIEGADVHTLEQCRIMGISNGHQKGTEALVTEYTIRTMAILRNGIPLWDPTRGLL